MKIKVEDDAGNIVAEHDWADEKLVTFCKTLETADASETQKALGFMDFTDELAGKIGADISNYVSKLMGWK